MAHIEDRWYRIQEGNRTPTPLCGRGLRYRVRYTDPDGRERSKSFPDRDRRAAEAFLVTVEADKLRGSYIDPRAGRISLRRYASEWLAGQTFDESTREATESRLRVHVYPYLGDRGLSSIRPSHVQAWDRALQQQGLAPTYRRVLFANLSAIFPAAVDDERIAKNPCRAASVKPPRLAAAKSHPGPATRCYRCTRRCRHGTGLPRRSPPAVGCARVRCSASPSMTSSSSAGPAGPPSGQDRPVPARLRPPEGTQDPRYPASRHRGNRTRRARRGVPATRSHPALGDAR